MTSQLSVGMPLPVEQACLILETIGDGFFLLDKRLRFTYLNPQTERIISRPKEELIGRYVWEEFPGAARSVSYQEYRRAEREKAPLVFQTFHKRLDAWFEVYAYPHPEGLSVFYRDINERERAEQELSSQKELLRKVIDTVPSFIFVKDEQGRFTLANKAVAELYGTTVEDLVGKTDADFNPDREEVMHFNTDDRKLVESIEELFIPEEKATGADGVTRWLQTVKCRFTLPNADAPHVLGISTDITERKRAEDKIRFQASLLDAVEQAVIATDLSGTVIYWNSFAERLFGWQSAEVSGRNIADLALTDLAGEDERIPSQAKKGERWSGEYEVRRRDGKSFTAMITESPIHDSDGNLVGVIGIYIDITENKRTEQLLRHILDGMPLFAAIMTTDGIMLEANESALVAGGITRKDIIGKPFEEAYWWSFSEESKTRLRGWIKRAAAGEFIRCDTVNRIKGGQLIDVDFSIAPLIDSEGRITHLIPSGVDISERKQAEVALRKSEARYRSLFESNLIGIMSWDIYGRIIDANETFLRMIAYPKEAIASGVLRWDEITPPEYRNADLKAFEQLMVTRSFDPYEKEFLTKDGKRIPVMLGGTLLPGDDEHGVAFALDQSGRKQLEVQFRQAQKMEAVGRLAGGIAHDFNNLLTAIIGYSQILLAQLKGSNPQREHVEEINKAGNKAANLTSQLLAFSRKQILQPKQIDLNEVVIDMEKMLKRLIGEDIDLVSVLAPGLRQVFADRGQIEQVIMNLAVNARDAMPNGGRLTIETQNVTLSPSYAFLHPGTEPGQYVMLAITDTGTGMDANILAHIFEPFFTTKETGKGTGLGLATVYGIVKQSEGTIAVYSEPGLGTTFKIYLPKVNSSSVEETEQVESTNEVVVGSETILLVEDDDGVRALTRKVLEVAGYGVLEASNGLEAIRVFEENARQFDLVLTDVVMPHMNGREMARRLWENSPQLKTIFMTGYTSNAAIRHELIEDNLALLQKPFTPSELTKRVREILDSPL